MVEVEIVVELASEFQGIAEIFGQVVEASQLDF